MSAFRILGLGTALPAHFIEQSEAADIAGTCLSGCAGSANNPRTLVQAVYRRSGVRTRHSVVLTSSTIESSATQDFYWTSDAPADLGPGTAARMERYEREAPPLAEEAVRTALQNAEVRPEQVTHLVTVSCSGFSAPGVDLHLIKALGFSAQTSRTHLGFMGCHGALNGLRIARALALTDPQAIVVMCAVELCTLHHQYGWSPQQIVANSLFADGAAAIIGCLDDKADVDETAGQSSVGFFPGSLVDSFSCVIPGTEDMMTWRIGDTGFQMTLSPEVPDIITRHLPDALGNFLGRHQLTISDIRSWAIHPGGPRILKACADVAGLSEEQLAPSAAVLSNYGNMSSPTVLFILDELRQRSAELPCVMLGFGPGLNVEAALLR